MYSNIDASGNYSNIDIATGLIAIASSMYSNSDTRHSKGIDQLHLSGCHTS